MTSSPLLCLLPLLLPLPAPALKFIQQITRLSHAGGPNSNFNINRNSKCLTTKWVATKEGLEYVKGIMAAGATTHSFFESILPVLIIYLPLLRVTQDLVSLCQLFKLKQIFTNKLPFITTNYIQNLNSMILSQMHNITS